MEGHKLAARKQWNATPCGTGEYLSALDPGSREFFDAVRHNRYEVTDRWMTRAIDFEMARGKKLLEIGYGLGTDLLMFCEGGAEVYGVDLSEEHHRLAQQNFEVHGKPCVLKLGDAASLDFPDGFFDYVYSHGALHHTPDTERCLSEARRVLKPGGRMILSLYHTYSAYHLFSMLLYQGMLKGKLAELGYRGLMSTVEYGANGRDIKPLVKTYSKKRLKRLMADLSSVEFRIAHINREHIPKLGKLMPGFLERRLEKRLGWYIIAFAAK